MSTATDMLALYIEAEKTILRGQSYTVDGNTFNRANLKEVRDGQVHWQEIVNKENNQASDRRGYSVASFS